MEDIHSNIRDLLNRIEIDRSKAIQLKLNPFYLNPQLWQQQKLMVFNPQNLTHLKLPCFLPTFIPDYMLKRMKEVLKSSKSYTEYANANHIAH
mgnify:CR=1 FL=1